MVLERSISGVMGGSMDEHDLSKLVAGLRGVLNEMADEMSKGIWAWSALRNITDDLDDRLNLLRKESSVEDVDVDEPDQYNVFEDQDGHKCG